MDGYRNGVSAGSITADWIKSEKSSANGQCVELASLPGGKVAMRNSTDPDGPAADLRGARDGGLPGRCEERRVRHPVVQLVWFEYQFGGTRELRRAMMSHAYS